MMYKFMFDKVLLPVAPSKLQLKMTNKNTTMTLINDGEINLLKSPGLTEISFEVMLPHVEYPFAVYENGYLPIPYFLSMFEQLKASRNPFQFIVTRISPKGDPLYNNDIKVSLEDYTVTDDVKEGFDVTVSISLKEYKEYKTKKLDIQTINGERHATIETQRYNAPAITQLKAHTVVKGDTLWGICKKYLGDGSKCYEIAKINNITDPNKIFHGQVIKFG